MSPSLKTNELLSKIIEHLQEGSYIVSMHALERQNQRLVDLKSVLYVLKMELMRRTKIFSMSKDKCGNTLSVEKHLMGLI